MIKNKLIAIILIAILCASMLSACAKDNAPFTNSIPQITAQPQPQNITVYITKTGSKYHKLGCRYLKQSCIAISLSEAKKKYTPCSVCNPPT